MSIAISNRTQISEMCHTIGNNIVCFPGCNTEESIRNKLSSIDADNIAHPFNEDKMIYKSKGSFYIFDKPNANFFINNISATDSALNARENIMKVPSSAVENLLGFNITDGMPNIEILSGPITLPERGTKVFMITNKNSGQYLDLVCYTADNKNCNYSTRNVHDIYHSGDRAFGGLFVHTLTIGGPHLALGARKPDFTIGGVGFSSTPLMSPTFTHQNHLCVWWGKYLFLFQTRGNMEAKYYTCLVCC